MDNCTRFPSSQNCSGDMLDEEPLATYGPILLVVAQINHVIGIVIFLALLGNLTRYRKGGSRKYVNRIGYPEIASAFFFIGNIFGLANFSVGGNIHRQYRLLNITLWQCFVLGYTIGGFTLVKMLNKSAMAAGSIKSSSTPWHAMRPVILTCFVTSVAVIWIAFVYAPGYVAFMKIVFLWSCIPSFFMVHSSVFSARSLQNRAFKSMNEAGEHLNLDVLSGVVTKLKVYRNVMGLLTLGNFIFSFIFFLTDVLYIPVIYFASNSFIVFIVISFNVAVPIYLRPEINAQRQNMISPAGGTKHNILLTSSSSSAAKRSKYKMTSPKASKDIRSLYSTSTDRSCESMNSMNSEKKVKF